MFGYRCGECGEEFWPEAGEPLWRASNLLGQHVRRTGHRGPHIHLGENGQPVGQSAPKDGESDDRSGASQAAAGGASGARGPSERDRRTKEALTTAGYRAQEVVFRAPLDELALLYARCSAAGMADYPSSGGRPTTDDYGRLVTESIRWIQQWFSYSTRQKVAHLLFGGVGPEEVSRVNEILARERIAVPDHSGCCPVLPWPAGVMTFGVPATGDGGNGEQGRDERERGRGGHAEAGRDGEAEAGAGGGLEGGGRRGLFRRILGD